eukprot:TRINITY_DN66624_c0_g1_i1.p1 TRINITY_DN66624_c0_g1~~TRINITY_DN66624_c0_g1_i1.p1  ORF type:complete len:899 (+),score=219.91 TRINITY_DN66624_c0_g1_i1:92-2788(+)
MKFGKLFLTEQRADWAEQYIDYEALKHWIDESREKRIDPSEARRTFISLITAQCRKAHGFTQSQIASLASSCDLHADGEAAEAAEAAHASGAGYSDTMSNVSGEWISEKDPLIADRRRLGASRSCASELDDVQSFKALNLQALAKITKKFHKNFQGARLPLSALVTLLEHGEDRGCLELILHEDSGRPAGATGNARKVYFAADPVVSLHVYQGRNEGGLRMEVRYTVPLWAWGALAALALSQLPVHPLLYYCAHSVDRDTDSEAILMHILIDWLVAAAGLVIWSIAGRCRHWGGETGPLQNRDTFLRQVYWVLLLGGIGHAVREISAVQSAAATKGNCDSAPPAGGYSVCPPLTLMSLTPLLLAVGHRLWNEAVHWPEVCGAALLALGAAAPLIGRDEGITAGAGAVVWGCAASLAGAVKFLCDRRVAELSPAVCIFIQRSSVLLLALAATGIRSAVTGDAWGLWEEGRVPGARTGLLWTLASALGWVTSCLIFLSLRHVTILVTAASITAAAGTGAIVIAPSTGWGGVSWERAAAWRAPVAIVALWSGATAVVLAQLLMRSRIQVPVAQEVERVPGRSHSPPPQSAPSLHSLGALRKRRRGRAAGSWSNGDVLGFVADVDRRRMYLGLNGKWRIAFQLPEPGHCPKPAAVLPGVPSLRPTPSNDRLSEGDLPGGVLSLFPGLTASENTVLRVFPPDTRANAWRVGPPRYPALTPERYRRPAAAEVSVIRGVPGAVVIEPARDGTLVRFSDFSTVGMPNCASDSGWFFFEVVLERLGRSAQLGWVALGSNLWPLPASEEEEEGAAGAADSAVHGDLDAGVGDDGLSWALDGVRAGTDGCWRWHSGGVLTQPWPLDPTESATGRTTPTSARLRSQAPSEVSAGSLHTPTNGHLHLRLSD